MSEIYNISGVLQRLKNVKKSGNQHTAKCPAHNDNQNSLSISEKSDKIAMYCHAGCTVNDVCAALGITVKDLFLSSKGNRKEKSRIVATYDYKDENGNLLYQAVRKEPKNFVQRQPKGNDWQWNLEGVRRILYRLPELMASGDSPAFICEGEKDADLLRSHGLTATTCALGAGKWRDEYSDSLTDRICYILPDNDQPGRDHAIQIAKSLYGKAREIRIVKLPVSKEKGDVSDWFQDGHTKEELLALVEQSPVWTGETKDEPELINRGEKSGNLSTLSASLFDGNLTLEVSRDGKRFKVVAKNSSGSLGMNVFNLAESAKRAKFVKDLGSDFDEEQIKEINRALLKLADEADNLPAVYDRADGTAMITTSFDVLSDGRVIEQIRGGFALYDPEDDTYSIVEKVEDADGKIYVPDPDDLLSGDRGMRIANDLVEYGTIAELDAALEAYILRYADVGDLQRKIIAKYIRLTYVCDKLFEIPYIAPTGDGGNGKTRVGELIVFASRRGLTLVSPSASSVFRNVDKYQPTLFIDEMNLTETGDDTAAILQILNSGIKRLTGFVSRTEKGPDGKFQSAMFKTFGAKIIGSLKKTNSMPFNSRCIQIEMQATKRTDIPYGTYQEMLDESQSLQNKLVLYRLRHCTTNFEPKLKEAEQTMKAAGLRPRTIQVNTPLLALTDDPDLRSGFIKLLQDADKVRVSEKLETLDGEIVQAIHEIIFDENGQVHILFEHGELCQDLRVEQILEAINADRKDKDKIDARRMGQLLNRNFMLKTKKIDIRNEHRDKKALIFDCQTLGKLFENFSLSGFPENTCRQCRQDAIKNVDNDLAGDKQDLTERDLSPNKSNADNSYEVATSGDKSFEENREKENNSHTSPFYAEPPFRTSEEFHAITNERNQSSQPANSDGIICDTCGAQTKMNELCVGCGEWNISI